MATNIENTSIWADVRDIMNPENQSKMQNLRAMIHTKERDVVPYKLLSFHEQAEFDISVGSTYFVQMLVSKGDYMSKIYPSRSNLEVTIKEMEHAEASKPTTVRYKAIFPKDRNPVPTGAGTGLYTSDDIDQGGFETIILELVDKGVEAMTLKTTGDSFSNIKQEDLLRLIIGRESSQIRIEGKNPIEGIDIVPPNNQDPFPQILIPDLTPVIELPSFLQNKVGGLYSTGMGSYIRNFNGKRNFFIYSLHDHTRFDKESDRLIIYVVPKERFSGIDTTWKKEGKILKIVTTSEIVMSDDAGVNAINEGSGFRMTDARALMKKPVIITETGIKASRAQLNHEVAVSSREDGYVKGARRAGASSNPYKEYSRLTAAQSQKVVVEWDYGNPNLIKPGMACKLVYLQDGKRVDIRGTVHKLTSTTRMNGNASTSELYTSNVTLHLAVERHTKAPQESSGVPIGKF